MWPQGISLGPVSFSGYGLAIVAAVFSALYYLNRMAPRAGVSPKQALDLGFWLIVVGLLGARATYVAFHPTVFARSPLNVIKYWEGGLMFQGGLIAGLILVAVLAILGRVRFLSMSDALAPALALGQAVGRLGCLLAGCCYGRPAPLGFPLALTFPLGAQAPVGLPLYPTQIAESLGLFLITLYLTRLLSSPTLPVRLGLIARPTHPARLDPTSGLGPQHPPRPAGLILAAYLALAGLLRFAVDLFRGDFRGPKVLGLAPTSWAALAIFLTGLILTLRLLANRGHAPNKKTPT
ncbi:MAG: prolipoprotein diacylglyceryl transferase [Deltaproteobacteria bacterium]|jgi:phosphatidylglycerol:prolipoprotein diacylglycerol transferase|nr:prolipoprotein diacylglyceryl transferase [Deltaproteobacteria bacterium]